MSQLKRTQNANEKLLDNRFPDDGLLDDIVFSLSRAQGIVGLINDAANLAQMANGGHEITMDNLERATREVEMSIKDALIMMDDLFR
ncbi:MAG: hypothetical protein QM500_03370 [Methylococcales bacterium]